MTLTLEKPTGVLTRSIGPVRTRPGATAAAGYYDIRGKAAGKRSTGVYVIGGSGLVKTAR
jgi:hypothetical protein